MGNRRERQRSQDIQDESGTNFWGCVRDISIRLIDVVYNLCNTGNIFSAIILLSFVFALYVTFKLPPENIDNYILEFIGFLKSEKFYLWPFSMAISFSIAANTIQFKVYSREIKRLSSVRSELMHGSDSGDLKKLKDHNPSNFDIDGGNGGTQC